MSVHCHDRDGREEDASFAFPFDQNQQAKKELARRSETNICVNSKSTNDRYCPSAAKMIVSVRRPPPLTVLMPYKNHSPMDERNEKRPATTTTTTTAVIKFKPFTSKEKESWLNVDSDHGFIRVYEPNSKELIQKNGDKKFQYPPSVVVPCTIDTTCRQICEKLAIGDSELHVTLNGDTVRRLDPSDKPLRIQNGYLSGIGITNEKRQQETGDSLDLCFLVKFTAGMFLFFMFWIRV